MAVSLVTGCKSSDTSLSTPTTPSSACVFTVSPRSFDAAAAGNAFLSVGVATTPQCRWTATANASFIRITSDTIFSGNGNLTFSVDPTITADRRTGSLSVAGETISINQEGARDSVTVVSLSPFPGAELSIQPEPISATATLRYTLVSADRAYICVIPYFTDNTRPAGAACETTEVTRGANTITTRFGVTPIDRIQPVTTPVLRIVMSSNRTFTGPLIVEYDHPASFTWIRTRTVGQDSIAVMALNPTPGAVLPASLAGTGGLTIDLRYTLGSRDTAFVCAYVSLPGRSPGTDCTAVRIFRGSGTARVRLSMPLDSSLPVTTTFLHPFIDQRPDGATQFVSGISDTLQAIYTWTRP